MDLVPGEIRVIAVGSPLRGDDGVGAVILDRLRCRSWPQRVRLIDGGTGGIDLLGLMDGAGQVILVDAVDMGRTAGELARFQLQEVRLADENGRSLSLHQAGLAEVLAQRPGDSAAAGDFRHSAATDGYRSRVVTRYRSCSAGCCPSNLCGG